jgi:serpin B
MKSTYSHALVVITLIAMLLATTGFAQDRSPQESVAQSATEFAVDLYRQMGEEGKNLFFSPYGIYTVLALMYGGAAGETAEQMAAALHVTLDAEAFQAGLADIQEILNQIGERGEVELNIANSLWPQSGAALKPEFLQLAARYLAAIYQVDYRTEPEAVRAEINAWAEEKTNGRIQNILKEPLYPETHLLLANAIFFKGDWIRQFDEAKTRSMPFHRLDHDTIEVPMMMQLGRFPFAWTDSAQILQLPYQGDDLSMTIVLPEDPQGLPSLEERMTSADIASWQEELSKQDVYGKGTYCWLEAAASSSWDG